MRLARHVVDQPTEGRVLWPPYYIVGDSVTFERSLVALLLERGREEDDARVRRGVYTSDSASAQAIQAAESQRAEICSTLHVKDDLETEDEELLRGQIERYVVAVGAARVLPLVV